MSKLLGNQRKGIIALLAVLALVVVASWLGARATPSARNYSFDEYPELFVETIACPPRGDAFRSLYRFSNRKHFSSFFFTIFGVRCQVSGVSTTGSQS